MILGTFERIVVWAALGLVMATAGITILDWQTWAILALVFIIQWSALNVGREDGAITTLQLPVAEFTRLQQELFEEVPK